MRTGTPPTPCIGRLLKLPTHTVTLNRSLAGTAQLSVKWRLVPVFAAAGKGLSPAVVEHHRRGVRDDTVPEDIHGVPDFGLQRPLEAQVERGAPGAVGAQAKGIGPLQHARGEVWGQAREQGGLSEAQLTRRPVEIRRGGGETPTVPWPRGTRFRYCSRMTGLSRWASRRSAQRI